MEELNSRAGQHRISLVNREVCAINGVSDVLSFDVGEVLLETERGIFCCISSLHFQLCARCAAWYRHFGAARQFSCIFCCNSVRFGL